MIKLSGLYMQQKANLTVGTMIIKEVLVKDGSRVLAASKSSPKVNLTVLRTLSKCQ